MNATTPTATMAAALAAHTPEPWSYHTEGHRAFLLEADGTTVAELAKPQPAGAATDAARIVACVNACAGIDTRSLAGVELHALLLNIDHFLTGFEDDRELGNGEAVAPLLAGIRAIIGEPTGVGDPWQVPNAAVAPPDTITLHLPLPDAFCADVLCNALEGGIGYWSAAAKITHTTIGDDPERHYASATLVDAEGDDDWNHVVDYDAIRRGIRLILSPGFKVANDIVLSTMQAVREADAGYIDADTADAIVQAACFGELVYG